jgi:hypothetical protein
MTQDALKRLTPRLNELDEADVKRSDVPISIVIAEGGAMLAALAKNAPLVALMQDAGMDPDLVNEEAPLALAALIEAQSDWAGERRGLTKQQVADALAEGYAARAGALELCDFYAHGKREAQGALSVIREGEGDADMVADLSALAAFQRTNAALFARRKNYDPAAEADKLDALAADLTSLLGEKVLGTDRKAALSLRDRAFTHADIILDEVRRYGRLVTSSRPPADRAIFSELYKLQSVRRSRARS